MNVAPATSSDRCSFSEITSRDGTKKSSQMRASAVETEVTSLHSAQGYVVISYREGRRRYFIQMEVSLLHRIRGYVVILFREEIVTDEG